MFSEHLNECRSLAAEASSQLRRLKDENTPESERQFISGAAFNLLKQADDSLQSIQFEAKAAPAAHRAELAKQEATLRSELKAVAQELEGARREALLGSQSTGTGGSTEQLFLAREERRRASATTECLRKGNDRLCEARRQSAETEQIGIETLQELRAQREMIMGLKDKTSEMDSNLNTAKKSLDNLEKPQCAVM
eukprot:gnl/TRDRNA2_/TRDRNA2_185434_c0_seq1.p2 gnl/TRDRNA2_/TRDRNA2_185434_c0~~gnl/TRDRNA2_/TRDRNA2_185434_c0_seq1.p2  ORF type:complete len:195 (-),score=60.29 gnl/TRDRNA2_/TRDRNA2_185434_c0_seq1:72-656(-)